MELTIKVKSQKVYDSLMKIIKSLNIEIVSEKKETKKVKKPKTDAVSLLSQKSLAEDWNSKEDDAWDKAL